MIFTYCSKNTMKTNTSVALRINVHSLKMELTITKYKYTTDNLDTSKNA